MEQLKFICWQDDDSWLGYLQDFPEFWTQGDTLDDLEAHLRDLYSDLLDDPCLSKRTS